MVGAMPCAVVAAISFGLAAYGWVTLPPFAYKVTGPDGKTITFPDKLGLSEMESAVSAHYKRPISFFIYSRNNNEVPYPTNPGRDAEQRVFNALGIAAVALAIGGAWYLATWALGWVIAGFRSD